MHTQHAKVVILGASFAGLAAARGLKGQDVILVDQKPEFEWTPNIHEVLSGVKAPRHLTVELMAIAQSLGHKFMEATVNHIDLAKQTLQLNYETTVSYDYLLIACGQTPIKPAITGIEKALCLKTVDDAAQLHQRLDQLRAKQNQVNVNVVGAGFTGIEVVGELLRRKSSSRLKINVIDKNYCYLHRLPQKVIDDVANHLSEHQVTGFLNTVVTHIEDEQLTLANGQKVASDLVIWTTGTGLSPFISDCGLKLRGKTGIAVDNNLAAVDYDNVFVAGDAASTPDPMAKQAAYALDMGALAAKNILASMQAKPRQTFKPIPKPIVLALGDINTYMIVGNAVVASPTLAPLKEAVFQLNMVDVSRLLPPLQAADSSAKRYLRSIEKLLLPQLKKRNLQRLLHQKPLFAFGK